MAGLCTSDELRALYRDQLDFAFIDPREEAIFTRAHLFAASNLPKSRLEILIKKAVPSPGTLIVVCDDGDGLANECIAILSKKGYHNLKCLEGGIPVWAMEGGKLFSGKNVPSKAFGEFIEKHYKPPSVTAQELHGMLKDGDDIVLYDVRPEIEHADYTIEGGRVCPGAELVYRIPQGIDTSTKIVVHCAGRTRGIIGAQTIRDWNLHHDVVWLENGAPAWDFEGYPLQRGQHEAIIPPETQLEERRIQARKLQTTWGIDNVDARDVKAWLKAYGTQRSTYCIDIRTWEEFQKGHLDEAQWVAGGQLLQQTDRYLVVRNSAILLLDDDGVRSTMVAVWLRRMGWPHIAVASIPADVLALGEKRPMSLSKPGFAEKIDDAKRVQLLASGSLLCDCRSSILYKNHPIQNAAYLNRENLKRDSTNLPRQVILLGDDLEYLDLIAKDLSGFGHDVYWLEEWQHLLVPKAAQKSHRYNYISRPVDTYLEAEHFEQGAVFKRENHAYLDWEIGLIKQIADEPAVDFWKP